MLQQVTLRPSRIGCPSIPGTMKGMILSIKGVKDVTIHYESRALDIMYDGEQTSETAIIKKIGNDMGLALEVSNASELAKEDVSEICPM